MLIRERIQTLVYTIDAGGGPRLLRLIVLALAVLALAGLYDLTAYHNFNSPEAMDAAQLARNLAEGQGYTTEFVRPFSLYLVSKHNQITMGGGLVATNSDLAQIKTHHPDLANPPLYPLALAGLMKVFKPEWKVEMRKVFWTEGGRFARYKPEFLIAVFNQLLLLTVVGLTFLLARMFFDPVTAWLSAALMLGSDLLWKFSVSGQSTLLLLVIFLGLLWFMAKIEERGRVQLPDTRRLFVLAATAGVLVGLGMLTRYAFGWIIVPTVIFLTVLGGTRRTGLAVAAFLAFTFTVLPWIARNLVVSGTFLGTAGYAVTEGTLAFPGSRLMQSINPDMTSAYWVMPYFRKFLENTRALFQGELLQLGGGWVGILFFSGLLLGLRNINARRMRYFTMGCLCVFIIAQALGRTKLSDYSPEINSENLLVLLTPLAAIFGVASFLKLLEQVNLPTLQVRYWAIGLMLVLACQPLIATLLPPKAPPQAYPPYYPPDVQKIAGWTHKDELLMSDVPWAVAWYGNRQCSWTTINSQYHFYQLNDNHKHVSGLYLTLYTLDGKLFSECLQGGVDSWGNFVYKTLAANQLPADFPLRNFPYESLLSGMFLADRQRW
ncbi:MAG: glycosyltransferase family 39 protein [Verrucomicrobiota bacterium]